MRRKYRVKTTDARGAITEANRAIWCCKVWRTGPSAPLTFVSKGSIRRPSTEFTTDKRSSAQQRVSWCFPLPETPPGNIPLLVSQPPKDPELPTTFRVPLDFHHPWRFYRGEVGRRMGRKHAPLTRQRSAHGPHTPSPTGMRVYKLTRRPCSKMQSIDEWNTCKDVSHLACHGGVYVHETPFAPSFLLLSGSGKMLDRKGRSAVILCHPAPSLLPHLSDSFSCLLLPTPKQAPNLSRLAVIVISFATPSRSGPRLW